MEKNVLIYFDLITSLKTTQEVSSFISEIDTLMLTFFQVGKNISGESFGINQRRFR